MAKLSEKLEKQINEQINAELWSAYLYLSMSMNAEAKGNKGVANWFFIQFKEEQDHARIFMNYINSRGGEVKLKAIKEVPTEWKSVLEMFKETLKHEKVVTSLINDIANIAYDERDFASINMINWFVNEQVEEEENANILIDSLEKLGDSKNGMYMFDKELAARVYNVPAPLAKTAE